jgi:aldose 1-epimerase
LHGGADGFGKRFWSATEFDARRLTLGLVNGEGDQGFPGEITAEATWSLYRADLLLTFAARTTKPTPLSLSAHPYFNLDRPLARDCLDHQVEIFAESYLTTDRKQISTSEVTAVAGTPFDFKRAGSIGERIREPDEQCAAGAGMTIILFFLREIRGRCGPAARTRSARSGRALEILTTQPGVQFYTGNNLDGSAPGPGRALPQAAGFAFEPQGFSNAPNQPNFPSTILGPGETYRQTIVYRLTADREKDAR